MYELGNVANLNAPKVLPVLKQKKDVPLCTKLPSSCEEAACPEELVCSLFSIPARDLSIAQCISQAEADRIPVYSPDFSCASVICDKKEPVCSDVYLKMAIFSLHFAMLLTVINQIQNHVRPAVHAQIFHLSYLRVFKSHTQQHALKQQALLMVKTAQL